MPSQRILSFAVNTFHHHLRSLDAATYGVVVDDHRTGRVENDRWERSAYVAHYVEPDCDFRVAFDVSDRGIRAVCECDTGDICRHERAVMVQFLVDRCNMTYESIRSVAAGAAASSSDASTADAAAGSPPAERKKPVGPPTRNERLFEFEKIAAARSGRLLSATERAWLSRVFDSHERARAVGYFHEYSMISLGFGVVRGVSPRSWPQIPEDPWTFLVWMVAAGSMAKCPPPHSLVPQSELEPAVEKLVELQRNEEIDFWKSRFNSFAEDPAHSSATYPLDFRVVLKEGILKFEWRRRDAARFAVIDRKAAEEIGRRIDEGLLTIPPEWIHVEPIIRHIVASGATSVDVRGTTAERVLLSRMLRVPGMIERLVDGDGEKIVSDPRPLRWKSEPAKNGKDIVVSLVDGDGVPVTEAEFVSPDRPQVLIAGGRMFDRVPPIPNLAADELSVVIPIEAIATGPGVEFFDDSRMPLPPEIERRVVRVPIRPVATAEVVRSTDGHSESVRVKFHAESPGGRVIVEHDGDHWIPAGRSNSKRPTLIGPTAPDAILVLDRSALPEADQRIGALGMRKKPDDPHIERKLTKQVLATLADWAHEAKDVLDLRFSGELAELKDATVAGRLNVEVEEDSVDWFDLRLVVKTDDTSLTPEEIALLTAAKGEFVKLPNRGWKRLSLSLTEEDDRRLAELGLSIRDVSEKKQKFHALQLSGSAAQKLLSPDMAGKIKRRADEISLAKAVQPPTSLKAELRPYQIDGFRFLTYLSDNGFGGILADDMGLGKTVQALAWIVWLKAKAKKKAAKPTLVVCPKSVADNWRAEAEKFAPDLRTRVWSSKELSNFADGLADADLHVVNYHQLRLAETALKAVSFGACILDEGQAIKNPSSVTAEIARALKTEHRLVMTGTPVENRSLDLWSLMSFAMPGVLGPRAHFLRVYEAKDDPLARRRLAARVRPFLLRRTKDTVAADLPPKVEEDLYCEMEGIQATLYRAELKKAQQMLLAVQTQSQVAKIQFNVLTALLRLRQICCDPRLVKPDAKGSSAKIDALMEHLEPLIEEGQKVIVFSQFVEAIDLLEGAMNPLGCPILRLTGDTEGRGELVREFQSTEGAAIFLISLRAGGFGLNLTAASYVVLFDPWWNPAVENQAIDRTHRIGQSKTVFAHRILVKGTIEEKIRSLQKKKAAVADEIFGEERFSQSLSLDDLRFLFAD